MKIAAFGMVAVVMIALAAAIAFLFALPVMWAWNYVIPDLFHMQPIGWVQAFCLTFLAATFFKSTTTKSD